MIETAAAFERLYRRNVPLPWDLKGPTPFVRELEEIGQIRGKVLDAGCGTGENALYLASINYHVVAVDGAPAAIEKAEAKAQALRIQVDFRVGDAREHCGFEEEFETVIDSGFFHVLGRKADRLQYAVSLRRACRRGGTVHLLAFRADNHALLQWADRLGSVLQRLVTGFGTHGVSEKELREAFSDGWAMEPLTQRIEGNQPFYLARIRRV